MGTAKHAPEDSAGIPSLATTLVFPLSGNPIGFNHFAAAEWLLRRNEVLSAVCFVLSNGCHPDPTKPDAEVAATERLALCRLAAAAVADPDRSDLARRAGFADETLHLGRASLEIATLEFGFDRAVRTTELIPLLRARDPAHKGPLHWMAGTDLVRRMADPSIFASEDLALLAEHCHYHVLERPGEAADSVPSALDALQAARGVRLRSTAYPRAELPGWLAPYLQLSSTGIRHAAEAGDPLGGMLPGPAAERIVEQGLYRPGRRAARLMNGAGDVLGERSELQLECETLQAALDAEAAVLAGHLDGRREQGLPHSLALVETTTGGAITAALAARAGASRYFRQSRFAYDGVAKASLLGPDWSGSAVSEEAVMALAEAMRREAQADYALAESGMAGPPDGLRRSRKYGWCCYAVAGPRGTVADTLKLNPFLTRREHQLRFALRALTLLHRLTRED